MKNRALAFVVVEEESREAVARTGVDDDGSIPPAKTGRTNEKRVDSAHWNSKGIASNRSNMARNGRGRRYQVRLFRGRVSIAKVDLDVDASRVAERRFGDPSKK